MWPTLVNADPREIVWTSGATESNNLALKGAAHFYKDTGKHLVTVKTEHKAVLDTMRELERQGFEVTYLDVQADGLLDLDGVQGRAAARHDPRLGDVRQQRDRRDPGHRGHRRDLPRRAASIFHVDAAQATGKVRDRPGHAAGRPDEPGVAQDLRPEGHRRAVRAAQAARAPRGADARRRPRARHAFGHAADAPDRRHGRGLPHRAAQRWAPRASASACCSSALLRGLPTSSRSSSTATSERRVPHNLNISFNFVEGEIADHGRSRASRCRRARPAPRRASSRATCCARWAAATSWRTRACA